VQFDPIKPMLKEPGSVGLKLSCDILLSTAAFKFNLRCYIQGVRMKVAAAMAFRGKGAWSEAAPVPVTPGQLSPGPLSPANVQNRVRALLERGDSSGQLSAEQPRLWRAGAYTRPLSSST
jgi:hypothetical protein